jgi:hypothetical protein
VDFAIGARHDLVPIAVVGNVGRRVLHVNIAIENRCKEVKIADSRASQLLCPELKAIDMQNCGGAMNSSDKPKGAVAKERAKGILIVFLLVVLAGAGGYFFGTFQKFAPIQSVAPGTPSAVEQTVSTTVPAIIPNGSGALKKRYWIHTTGDEHVGYAITVLVNGQLVDKFFAPGRDVEVTKLMKPGENQVTFQASVLPESMNEHKGQDNFYLRCSIASGSAVVSDPRESDVLLNYKRTGHEASDGKAFNDTLTFLTME